MGKRKSLETFSVRFEGGGTMIVRAPGERAAGSYAEKASRALVGDRRPRIVSVTKVRTIGFGKFEAVL